MLDLIAAGTSRAATALFRPLVDALLVRDDYMLLADYRSYIEGQEAGGEAYRDRSAGPACRS